MESSVIIAPVLRLSRLFEHVTEEELSSVADLCIVRNYQKNDHLFFQDEPMTHVYFAVEGRIKNYRIKEDGKEQTILLADKGEMFPHVGFFRTGTYPDNALALQDAVCLAITIPSFEQLLIGQPAISFKMLQVLADKIIDLQDRLEAKTFHSVESQLISLLIRLSEVHSTRAEGEWHRFFTPFSNQELAGMLGSTRETINRSINKLRKQQAVDFDNNGLLLIRTEKLSSMQLPVNNDAIKHEKQHSLKLRANECCIRGRQEI
jgi:CRP/FNR family cyclic AMP-dependent transcriptional regulator